MIQLLHKMNTYTIIMKPSDVGQHITEQGKDRERIRVAEHSFQVHLLFAVWAGLFLPHDAPASYAELMESGDKG